MPLGSTQILETHNKPGRDGQYLNPKTQNPGGTPDLFATWTRPKPEKQYPTWPDFCYSNLLLPVGKTQLIWFPNLNPKKDTRTHH